MQVFKAGREQSVKIIIFRRFGHLARLNGTLCSAIRILEQRKVSSTPPLNNEPSGAEQAKLAVRSASFPLSRTSHRPY